MNKCLYCYSILGNGENDFHPKCSKKFFGTATTPEIPFSLSELLDVMVYSLGKGTSISGVQPKIALEKRRSAKNEQRFALASANGEYILKTPVSWYPELPENEAITMRLAQILNIKTAEHSLIRLKSGELAYITKRFDRTKKGGKVPVEDMAQLTGTLTENKYLGSMEMIGKVIKQYCSYPMFDLITLYELTLFAFITGNADMHLKNFSLLCNEHNEVLLSPAYDLLATKLLISADNEELALPMNGKNSKLRRKDFITFAESLGLNSPSVAKIHKKISDTSEALIATIEHSFLCTNSKIKYKELLAQRIHQLGKA